MDAKDPEHAMRPPCCWRCGRTACFRVDEPIRGCLDYCREHFHRLIHVAPGSAVRLITPPPHDQFRKRYADGQARAS